MNHPDQTMPQRNAIERLEESRGDVEMARAGLAKENAALRLRVEALEKDKARLDWLEHTQTGIGYNVEVCAWGADFESPYANTIRGAIDEALKAIYPPAIGEPAPPDL